jgi:hypothetical protein
VRRETISPVFATPPSVSEAALFTLRSILAEHYATSEREERMRRLIELSEFEARPAS